MLFKPSIRNEKNTGLDLMMMTKRSRDSICHYSDTIRSLRRYCNTVKIKKSKIKGSHTNETKETNNLVWLFEEEE